MTRITIPKASVTKTFVEQTYESPYTTNLNFQLVNSAIHPYFQMYMRFYASILPLGDAIDLIASQFASIVPKICNIKTKEYIEDHPLLTLLTNPNNNVAYNEFAESMSSFFELTGNQYWRITTSRLDGQPLEIYSVPPEWLSPTTDNLGMVDNYLYSQSGLTITYYKQYIDGRLRYVSEDGRSQLIHLKRFNPSPSGYLIFGLSKLHSMFYELEQYRLQSLHNQALLQNGGRPSGMITSKEDMTKEQFNEVRTEVEAMFQGTTNAGRPMIGMGLTWQDFTQNLRDMDFSTARTQIRESIYNRLKIPLALINSNALSLANMKTAMTQLYDLAILPMASKLYDALTLSVLSLYPNSENLILTYDPSTIQAVKDRNLQQVKTMASFNVLSDNELRNKIDTPIREGGDSVYKLNTMVAVGSAPPVSGRGQASVDSTIEDVDNDTDEEPSDDK